MEIIEINVKNKYLGKIEQLKQKVQKLCRGTQKERDRKQNSWADLKQKILRNIREKEDQELETIDIK